MPAQLGFLAIYNPSLGTTDETLANQILYYSSKETRRRWRRPRSDGEVVQDISHEEKNERLRQIGLAQGMVEFGRSFSEGRSVDSIETEKSRIILHELELGWWLLASIELTQLPTVAPNSSDNKKQNEAEPGVEYSSREVKPPALLLQDLLRAHTTFLLHHASSMAALFVRTRRSKFVGILGRYWDSFLSSWTVLLHGNPAVNLYGGIKLAGCGELGIGVGEEDRGSGEREFLEGLIERIEGLVDVVVSRFGDDSGAASEVGKDSKEKSSQLLPHTSRSWLGTGAEPSLEDGAVFLGSGALSRKSVRDLTHWMEDLYTWGPNAYGVMDNPASLRKEKRHRTPAIPSPEDTAPTAPQRATEEARKVYGVDEQAVKSQRSSLQKKQASSSDSREAAKVSENSKSKERRPTLARGQSSQSSSHSSITANGGKFANFLKLGYGTHWTLGASTTKPSRDNKTSIAEAVEETASSSAQDGVLSDNDTRSDGGQKHGDELNSFPYPSDDSVGHFLIGLIGNIEDEAFNAPAAQASAENLAEVPENYRTSLRTLTVELERESDARAENELSIELGTGDSERVNPKTGGSEHTGTSTHASFESQDRNKTKRLRVVVYANKPFIFTFLFELRSEGLALQTLYRSLHHQLGPLQKPLLVSTTYRSSKPDVVTSSAENTRAPIYDLLWDSKLLTVSSTIPNIPEHSQVDQSATESAPWSRLEALNTHMQILNTFTATRLNPSELERTCKTSRGWWIVWTRIPDPISAPTLSQSASPIEAATPQLKPEDGKADKRRGGTSTFTSITNRSMQSGPAHPFLDSTPSLAVTQDKEIILIRRASDYVAPRSASRFASGTFTSSDAGWGSGPSKLAQGIGVDTKRYIEGLLNLNR